MALVSSEPKFALVCFKDNVTFHRRVLTSYKKESHKVFVLPPANT